METNVFEALIKEILERENAGDRGYFEARLAAHMSMRRSSGMVVDGMRFLTDIKPGGDRELLCISSIELLGSQRACVRCQVRSTGKIVENFLLFVRQGDAPEGWLLLAWANELM